MMQKNYILSNDTIIRKTTIADIPQLRKIFAIARQFMANTGNPSQWVDGYPSDEQLTQDIENGDSYVVEKDEKVVATFVLRGGIDPTYNIIYEGKWLNDKPYATIHRIASTGEIKGIMHIAMQFAPTLSVLSWGTPNGVILNSPSVKVTFFSITQIGRASCRERV